MSGSSSETKLRFRESSEDGSSCSTVGGREFNDDNPPDGKFYKKNLKQKRMWEIYFILSFVCTMQIFIVHSPVPPLVATPLTADVDTESYSSSVESINEDDRVYLQIGEQLKSYLEYDYMMIMKNNKLINLPEKIPVITILENYVKHCSIKEITCPAPIDHSRRRNSSAKMDKREKNYEKLSISINVRKEVADGLRTYFDFTLKDYLLYKPEKEQASTLLSAENLKNFTYIASERQYDMLTFKQETPGTPFSGATDIQTEPTSSIETQQQEDNAKRRLRSYKTEENEFIFDIGLQNSGKGGENQSRYVYYTLINNNKFILYTYTVRLLLKIQKFGIYIANPLNLFVLCYKRRLPPKFEL